MYPVLDTDELYGVLFYILFGSVGSYMISYIILILSCDYGTLNSKKIYLCFYHLIYVFFNLHIFVLVQGELITLWLPILLEGPRLTPMTFSLSILTSF